MIKSARDAIAKQDRSVLSGNQIVIVDHTRDEVFLISIVPPFPVWLCCVTIGIAESGGIPCDNYVILEIVHLIAVLGSFGWHLATQELRHALTR